MKLQYALITLAVVQVIVAFINLFLPRMLKWREDVEKLSLLPRQVFNVHLWFISITLWIFGVLTLRFSEQMAFGLNEPAIWIAAAIGVFWGIRTVVQMAYYSPKHWWGKRARI